MPGITLELNMNRIQYILFFAIILVGCTSNALRLNEKGLGREIDTSKNGYIAFEIADASGPGIRVGVKNETTSDYYRFDLWQPTRVVSTTKVLGQEVSKTETPIENINSKKIIVYQLPPGQYSLSTVRKSYKQNEGNLLLTGTGFTINSGTITSFGKIRWSGETNIFSALTEASAQSVDSTLSESFDGFEEYGIENLPVEFSPLEMKTKDLF